MFPIIPSITIVQTHCSAELNSHKVGKNMNLKLKSSEPQAQCQNNNTGFFFNPLYENYSFNEK